MGSQKKSQDVELTTLRQDHDDIENMIQRLDEIQHEFHALQNKIKHNEELYAEHLYLIQHQAEDVEISIRYANQVKAAFNFLYISYEGLKRKLHHFLSAQEIQQIEDSVTAVMHDEHAFTRLIFFPDFQAQHTAAVTEHTQQLNQQKHYNNQDIWIDSVNYEERVTAYRTWYLYTGLLSIIGVGIPLLLGGVITHLIDKLKVALNVKAYERNNKEIDKKIETEVHPELPKLKAKVNMDTENLLRQGFFSLAKQRFNKEVREVELTFKN